MGGPRDEAGQDVEAAAHAHDYGHLETVAVTLTPYLLKRGGHTDEQHMGAASPDFLNDAQMIVGAKIAVAEASDFKAGVLRLGARRQSRDNVALGAKEIDAQSVFPSSRQ